MPSSLELTTILTFRTMATLELLLHIFISWSAASQVECEYVKHVCVLASIKTPWIKWAKLGRGHPNLCKLDLILRTGPHQSRSELSIFSRCDQLQVAGSADLQISGIIAVLPPTASAAAVVVVVSLSRSMLSTGLLFIAVSLFISFWNLIQCLMKYKSQIKTQLSLFQSVTFTAITLLVEIWNES